MQSANLYMISQHNLILTILIDLNNRLELMQEQIKKSNLTPEVDELSSMLSNLTISSGSKVKKRRNVNIWQINAKSSVDK